ncbi:hypothetical protein [Leptothrix discophora]|uniref:Big-1 domain-containing protein n=1 Tax=Leptothrix discophora TaxID=89 RepID=A0ABT9G633_LEPDI|nr:hypothetical protein [Leptothrix discophora]MDP4301936.1 hypothetical protein [Leptothrix discophora]
MRSMKLVRTMAVCLLATVLSSCGGGGGSDAGTSPFGGNTTPVAGDTTGGTVAPLTASDLLVTLSSTSLSNSGASTVGVTVTAVNANRVALANVPITVRVDNNAVIALSGTATASNGTLTGTVGIGTDRSNRIVTVTAISGGVSRSASFNVVGAQLNATVLQAVLAPSGAGQIDYRLLDVNSNAMVGLPISVSAAGLATGSGVTDSNGVYTYRFTAPSTASTLNISAVAGGVSRTDTVIVQAGSGSIPAVTATIASATVTSNPSVVSVNSSTSNNRSEVRALFLGSANSRIPNVRVRFDLNNDPNSIGGTLSTGNNVVYSDANGVASTAYIPGPVSSPTNGVTVRACYYETDADATAGACLKSALTTLTVISEPLSVSIGTDNTISEGAGGLTFVKRFVVLVVDSAGQAKANVRITPSVDLLSYVKGIYGRGTKWTTDQASGGYRSANCINEDGNRNSVLETGEDINGNGQLDPRKSDVAISMIGTGETDASGVATLQIQYPKNVATWVNYRILVSAAGIAGTEGRAEWVDTLGAAASEFDNATSPSFAVSPYGVGDPSRIGATECTFPD